MWGYPLPAHMQSKTLAHKPCPCISQAQSHASLQYTRPPVGLAQPGRLALEALSAGGLTAGALLNRRPGSVSAALLEAPFVDVLTAMCDPGLPLTMHEYEEWGDPRDPQVFEQVRPCNEGTKAA